MKNLKEIRKRNHLTQKEMAEKLHITQATYSGYETQKYSPTIDVLCKISSILKCPIDEIVGINPKLYKLEVLYKINYLNEENLLRLDGYLTALILCQDDLYRKI